MKDTHQNEQSGRHSVARSWRLPVSLDRRLKIEAERRGLPVSEVARELLDGALGGGVIAAAEQLEARVSATLIRLLEEVERLGSAQQATIALVDCLAKAVLLRLPDPPDGLYREARARAEKNHERLIIQSGRELQASHALLNRLQGAFDARGG